jgi:hypothetical protein
MGIGKNSDMVGKNPPWKGDMVRKIYLLNYEHLFKESGLLYPAKPGVHIPLTKHRDCVLKGSWRILFATSEFLLSTC